MRNIKISLYLLCCLALLSSCSGSRYGYMPKAKAKPKTAIAKRVWAKKVLQQATLPTKNIIERNVVNTAITLPKAVIKPLQINVVAAPSKKGVQATTVYKSTKKVKNKQAHQKAAKTQQKDFRKNTERSNKRAVVFVVLFFLVLIAGLVFLIIETGLIGIIITLVIALLMLTLGDFILLFLWVLFGGNFEI